MVSLTIVTVTYNAEFELECTIESVLKQDYKELKYIIMDGKSTDGTIDIIKKYEKKFITKEVKYEYVSQKDNGIYDAMNKSLKYCDTDYVMFLNAGDMLFDKKTINSVFTEPSVVGQDIIYGDYYLYYKNFRKKIISKDYTSLPTGMISTHQSFLVKTQLLKDRPFDVRYTMTSEYDFFLEMFLNNKTFYHVALPIVYFKTGGISQQKPSITLKELKDIKINHGAYKSKSIISEMYDQYRIVIKKKVTEKLPEVVRYFGYEKIEKLY